MKLSILLPAAAAAALVLAAPSYGTASHHRSWAAMTLRERRAVVVHDIRVQRAPIRSWLRVRSRDRNLEGDAHYRLCRALGTVVPGPVCVHGQRLVHDLAVLRRIKTRIAAANAARGPAHLAGWRCITNGAYPGAAHEGNGYNGSYTGPLGMTTPWLGHYPPGSDWVHSDPAAVYAIAEAEAAARNFSYSWMSGQWPNTFPPCAGYF